MVLYRQEQSTSKGRHLVANAQIEAGTTFLVERPMVASLYESASAQRCDVTFQSERDLELQGTRLLRCSRWVTMTCTNALSLPSSSCARLRGHPAPPESSSRGPPLAQTPRCDSHVCAMRCRHLCLQVQGGPIQQHRRAALCLECLSPVRVSRPAGGRSQSAISQLPAGKPPAVGTPAEQVGMPAQPALPAHPALPA